MTGKVDNVTLDATQLEALRSVLNQMTDDLPAGQYRWIRNGSIADLGDELVADGE